MTHTQGSSLLVFAAGVAVGAVVSALYAPTSGRALRRRIGQAAQDGVDMAEDALHQADEFVRDQAASAQQVINRSGEAFRKVREDGAE
jgi:gas vesicle protein